MPGRMTLEALGVGAQAQLDRHWCSDCSDVRAFEALLAGPDDGGSGPELACVDCGCALLLSRPVVDGTGVTTLHGRGTVGARSTRSTRSTQSTRDLQTTRGGAAWVLPRSA